MMHSMFDIDCHERRVIVRVDYNVPIKNGNIMDDQRIRATLPCLTWLLEQNAGVLLLSHLGRPKAGALTKAESLAPIANYLSKALGMQVPLVNDWLGGLTLTPGTISLAENVRALPGETDNDVHLSKRMAALCDVYVMDAFGSAHRAHASTEGIMQFAKVACQGPLLQKECQMLSKLCEHPQAPVLTIVGGAKIASKIGLLKALLARSDTLVVGGGMANTFLAATGIDIGASLCEKDLLDTANSILQQAQKQGVDMPLPVDVRVVKALCEHQTTTKQVHTLARDDIIVDIGPQTEDLYTKAIVAAKTVLWNGPVGIFEQAAFAHGTQHMAQTLAKHDAFCVAGGGDTVAAVNQFKVGSQLSYVSTGGGAFLQYLEGSPLPSLEALKRAWKASHG